MVKERSDEFGIDFEGRANRLCQWIERRCVPRVNKASLRLQPLEKAHNAAPGLTSENTADKQYPPSNSGSL